jgi:hypothetical protein
VFASIFLLVAAPSSSPYDGFERDAFERITVQEAANRLAQCGFGPVTTRYDADLDEDVLIATGAKSATDEQLACADRAVSYYTLQLSPNIQPHYDAKREARLSELFQTQARDWLAARGLLNRLPKYQEGVTNDAGFARQVESLCGPRAKGAFESKFGVHAFSPEWIRRELKPTASDQGVFWCLVSATTAAGFKVGFIGNEYYRR